jgi:hypothetical protein
VCDIYNISETEFVSIIMQFCPLKRANLVQSTRVGSFPLIYPMMEMDPVSGTSCILDICIPQTKGNVQQYIPIT